MESDTSIPKALLPYPPDESITETSTLISGAIITYLPDHQVLRPPSYAHDAVEETTPTQFLVPQSHSEAVVRKLICTQDILAPSPSEQEP